MRSRRHFKPVRLVKAFQGEHLEHAYDDHAVVGEVSEEWTGGGEDRQLELRRRGGKLNREWEKGKKKREKKKRTSIDWGEG